MLQGVIYLLKNSDVATLIGRNKANTKAKIYPNICPEQEQKKYMILRITGKTPWECKEARPTTYTYSFSVIFFTQNYYELDLIQDAVEEVLNKYEGQVNGVTFQEIRFVTSNDSFEKDYQLHARVMSFDADVDAISPYQLVTDDGDSLQTDDENNLQVDH